MKKIQKGEDAISFFAKYGNSTAIKFIYCEKNPFRYPGLFRPYDLKVIDD